MTTNKAIKTSLILFFLIFPLTVNAWNSIGYENHRRITNDAINDLGIYDYPDLDMYRGMYGGNGVVEGSATEGSHTDPKTGIEHWEGPYEYWKKQATDNYKASNFRNAYDYFGYYLHLIQDTYVPAHEKKCAHWVWYRWTDSLESFADSNHFYSSGTIPPWGGYDSKGRYWEYWLADNEDDDDGNETTADINDASQSDGPNSYNLLSTWGTYGRGKWPKDKIPGNDKGEDWYTGNGNSAFIAYEQLYKTFIDTKAELKEFSESLPPLVKDIAITPLNCNTQSDIQISFKILENRKKTVKIFMAVDGEAIISPEYSTGKSFDLFSGTDLPWEGAYSVTWDGKFATGQYPSEGEHTLYVSVEDEDGNVSEVAQHQFSIGTGTLTISGAETITRNSSTQYTASGCPSSINWSVSGTGATISSTGLLNAGATTCGSLTVTATCAGCGTSATQYVRVTDAGRWVATGPYTYYNASCIKALAKQAEFYSGCGDTCCTTQDTVEACFAVWGNNYICNGSRGAIIADCNVIGDAMYCNYAGVTFWNLPACEGIPRYTFLYEEYRCPYFDYFFILMAERSFRWRCE